MFVDDDDDDDNDDDLIELTYPSAVLNYF